MIRRLATGTLLALIWFTGRTQADTVQVTIPSNGAGGYQSPMDPTVTISPYTVYLGGDLDHPVQVFCVDPQHTTSDGQTWTAFVTP